MLVFGKREKKKKRGRMQVISFYICICICNLLFNYFLFTRDLIYSIICICKLGIGNWKQIIYLFEFLSSIKKTKEKEFLMAVITVTKCKS